MSPNKSARAVIVSCVSCRIPRRRVGGRESSGRLCPFVCASLTGGAIATGIYIAESPVRLDFLCEFLDSRVEIEAHLRC